MEIAQVKQEDNKKLKPPMLKRFKRIAPLIIGICFIFPLSSIYFHYNALVEADFLYFGLKFEASDLEDLFVDKQNIWDFRPIQVFALPLSDTGFYKELTHSCPIILSPDQDSPILRC